MELNDGKVRLRRPARGDVEFVREAAKDDYIPQITTIPLRRSKAEALAWIESQGRRQAEGRGRPFVIADTDTDEALGFIALWNIEDEWRGRIGYWVLERARGRGLALAAVRLVTRWALKDGGFRRVEALIEPWNHASMAVAERAGFVREGLLRSYYRVRSGELVDVFMYSLLPDDLR